MQFGSALIYSPRGGGEISKRSRDWCYAVKDAKPPALKTLAEAVAKSKVLAPLFANTPLLVPIPRSAPLVAGALWPAKALCEALIVAGVAQQMEPLLERVVAVPKSSHAAPGQRPGIQLHFDSMTAAHSLLVTHGIVLVDDVLTKGTTALGAEKRLRTIFQPSVPISLFAAVRTMGLVPDVERILDPAVGQVTAFFDEGERQP